MSCNLRLIRGLRAIRERLARSLLRVEDASGASLRSGTLADFPVVMSPELLRSPDQTNVRVGDDTFGAGLAEARAFLGPNRPIRGCD
jgi:hypothetical protein